MKRKILYLLCTMLVLTLACGCAFGEAATVLDLSVAEPVTAPAAETETPAAEAPATEAPATEAPATQTPATETLTDGQIVATLADQLDPNRSIDVYAQWEGELHFGDAATLCAVLHGYDNVTYTLQWQYSKDNVTWTDVKDAVGKTLSLTVTEDNYLNYWRVLVTVSDKQ